MKRTKIKILITLVVGVVVLFLIFFMVFNKPESVPNGSASIWTYTPYIELDGNKYLFEDPLGKSNLFFEVQDNWEELEDCSVQYVNFSCEDNLAEDAIYCDISQVCTYDLYLKVSEEWLMSQCNINGHSQGFIRLHICSPLQIGRASCRERV